MTESLRAGDAHVWYLWPDRVTSPARLEMHERILSADERARISSFRFERDRHSRLLTRAFVRTLLARYAGVAAYEWEFAADRYGKPEISGPRGAPPITFSVSHTTGLIACVFAFQTAVGIDAEYLVQSVDSLSIARDYFSPIEYSALHQLTNSARHRRFLEYWTLKEAYAKALGLGMSMSLSGFTFHIEDQRATISFETHSTEDPASWEFRLLKPGDQHSVATAMRCSPNLPVNFEVRDGTGLMQ